MGQVSYFFICCLGKRKLHILRTSVVLSFLSHMAGFGLHHSPYSLLSIFSDVLWKGHKDTFSKSKQELGRKTWGWIYLLDFSHVLFQNLKIIITEMSHLVAQMVKNLPAMQETWVQSLAQEIPWWREWQPTPIFLPGEFPWTEEPDGLQSMGLQRVGHDWATNTFTFSCITRTEEQSETWLLVYFPHIQLTPTMTQ